MLGALVVAQGGNASLSKGIGKVAQRVVLAQRAVHVVWPAAVHQYHHGAGMLEGRGQGKAGWQLHPSASHLHLALGDPRG